MCGGDVKSTAIITADSFKEYRICTDCQCDWVLISGSIGGKPVEPVPNRRAGSKTDGGVASVIVPLGRATGATGLSF